MFHRRRKSAGLPVVQAEVVTAQPVEPVQRHACQYGSKCYRKNLEHLRQYAHPGDRNYRMGMVIFDVRKGVPVPPEFLTLRELFNYCDPDESGHLSKEEFESAWNFIAELPGEHFGGSNHVHERSLETAWDLPAGHTHMTFVEFAHWAHKEGINLPMGVDLSDSAKRPCRFQYAGGDRCDCQDFTPAEGSGSLCVCGHKASLHISEVAQLSYEDQEILSALAHKRSNTSVSLGDIKWNRVDMEKIRARRNGVDFVTDPDTLQDLRQLLTLSHKTSNNWTRDRGCALHGRNGCALKCLAAHQAPVPLGYELVRAERTRNASMWHSYVTTRGAIKRDLELGVRGDIPFTPIEPRSSMNIRGEEPLDPSINEWRLLHGAPWKTVQGISKTGFLLRLAGSGATWKEPGHTAGVPLYGYGCYLAENSTKADEYSTEIVDGLRSDEGCCTMLVCRVTGGFCHVVETNEYDKDQLRKNIFDGNYHSVLGDRVKKLNKPFREIVVYDTTQVFPEFILYYRRLFKGDRSS